MMMRTGDDSLRCGAQLTVGLQEAGAGVLGGGHPGVPARQEPQTAGQWGQDQA